MNNEGELKITIGSQKIKTILISTLDDLYSFQHLNDKYKIDKITCYISSFSRKKIDLQELEGFLISQNYEKGIVHKVINRIEIGLDVLTVNKNVDKLRY